MQKFFLAALLLFAFPLHAQDDLPPGCVPQQGPGGCVGKAMIKDIQVTPQGCLFFSANNCNGGVAQISNQCDQDITLGELSIPLAAGGAPVELYKDNGKTRAKLANGNYASYTPATDEPLEISGMIGGKTPFKLHYVKTKPLCK